jgi:hypothetical protein
MHISMQNHSTVSHIWQQSIVFKNCGFSLNQTNDGKDATELSIAKDDWGQPKAGVPLQEYVSCDNDDVMCEVQTLEQMMAEKFTSDMSKDGEKEDDGG